MVLRPRFLISVILLVLAASPATAQATPRPGEVSLPLKDYLALVETVERVERERAQKAAQSEAPLAEVVSQRVAVVLASEGAETAEVTSEFEVLIQGAPRNPVELPMAGVPMEAVVRISGPNVPAVQATAAVTASSGWGSMRLVAPGPGRYTVQVKGPVRLSNQGIRHLSLPAVAAPVASTEIDLPADLTWSLPGSIVVDERVEGGRRKVRVTAPRGEAPTLEVRRRGDNGDADKLLAQSSILTLVQLGPEGPRRHDVVLYDVSRGNLGSFTVDLPPGLSIEKAGTDEGDVVPVVEARRLIVHRRAQLRQTGYLVLTSTPSSGAGGLPLDPVTLEEAPVRARYLALSTSVAAEARPLPENGWRRVDLDDLPPMFRDALSALDLAAAWRLTGVPTGLAMAVSPLPAAPVLPSVVRLRETTTLLTVDGTLLHRDLLILRPTAGLSARIDLVLPPAGILWSAKVDGLPVRPLERDGTLSIPLGFDSGKESVVEVVAVLEKAIPQGRSELALTLPRVAVPVQEHRWRLLLPDGHRYRFRSGDLRPASGPPAMDVVARPARALSQAEMDKVPTTRDPWAALQSTPGVLTDRINVGGNESGQQQSMYAGPGGRANLRGRVVDDQGIALPGVTVTIDSGTPTAGVTDAQGFFTFVALPAGNYGIRAELEGFANVEYSDVRLSDGETKSVEITMSAAVEDTITVSAEPPPLDLRKRPKPATPPAFDAFAEEAKSLQQGLVGGVKPLNVAIPESGKVLLLTGVLPPAEVTAELEVRAQKR